MTTSTGMANFMSSVSSGYPASGSFSRSSLNAASGSRTAMSKGFTIVIMVITLSFFTQYLRFIPYAALSAIIWASIYNIVVFSDFWFVLLDSYSVEVDGKFVLFLLQACMEAFEERLSRFGDHLCVCVCIQHWYRLGHRYFPLSCSGSV